MNFKKMIRALLLAALVIAIAIPSAPLGVFADDVTPLQASTPADGTDSDTSGTVTIPDPPESPVNSQTEEDSAGASG